MTFTDRNGQNTTATGFDGGQATNPLSKAFLAGKAYRAYIAFTGATQARLIATKPFLLTSQTMYCDAGQATAVITVGSTLGGSWTPLATKFPVNGVVSPAPTPTITIEVGGTITGGTERERLRSAAGTGGNASGVTSTVNTPRLLPAGTYSIALTVSGTTAAIYSIEYQELDTAPV
jgi:hypothetical protein